MLCLRWRRHPGHRCVASSLRSQLFNPVRQGVVADWDAMERFWQRSLFQ
jgi:actin-related protein